jgi:hypothetical protein
MAFLQKLNTQLIDFIQKQQLYFVATAAQEGRINLSPKGLDSLRILDNNHVLWLNLTGSGNETAAHLLKQNRMTMMFCSFSENPLILRLYGSAITYHQRDTEWNTYIEHFDNPAGSRNLFLLQIESVQTSCGYGVPNFDFIQERTRLTEFIEQKGKDGIKQYWEEKNVSSIDGLTTGLFLPED